jgi:hypothetical protein
MARAIALLPVGVSLLSGLRLVQPAPPKPPLLNAEHLRTSGDAPSQRTDTVTLFGDPNQPGFYVQQVRSPPATAPGLTSTIRTAW